MKKRLGILLGIVVLIGIGAVLFTARWRNLLWGYAHGESLYRGRPVSYWQEALKDDDAQVGADTIEAFAQTGPAGVPALIATLNDPNALARERAAEALSRIGKQCVPQLIVALKDDSPFVRSGAARALAHMGPQASDAVPTLIDGLSDEIGFVRSMVRNALSHIGPAALPALEAALQAENKDVRFRALLSLQDMGPPGSPAATAVAAHLTDKNMAVRILAAETLWSLGPGGVAAAPDLLKVVSQPGHREFRVKAIHALGKVDRGSDKTIASLMAMLHDEDDLVRQQSAQELGTQGAKAKIAVAALKESLNDPNQAVKSFAEMSLRQLDYDWALQDYEQAVKRNPKEPQGHSDLAWLRATCPDAKVRDGKQAIEHATKACELTQWQNAAYLETLAAAHAQNGDFKQAVQWQTKALEGHDPNLDVEQAQSRLKLYQLGKAYRAGG
jgi:HEAT repeat protein